MPDYQFKQTNELALFSEVEQPEFTITSNSRGVNHQCEMGFWYQMMSKVQLSCIVHLYLCQLSSIDAVDAWFHLPVSISLSIFLIRYGV